jgi:hypothetical protein
MEANSYIFNSDGALKNHMKRKTCSFYCQKRNTFLCGIDDVRLVDRRFVEEIYFTQESGFLYRTTYALEKTMPTSSFSDLPG